MRVGWHVSGKSHVDFLIDTQEPFIVVLRPLSLFCVLDWQTGLSYRPKIVKMDLFRSGREKASDPLVLEAKRISSPNMSTQRPQL
jgi:hypothetical protein